MVTRERILDQIRRTSENGEALGQKGFTKATGIRPKEWERYWPRWSDAIAEAGFEARLWNAKYDDADVLNRLIIEIRRLGRLPTGREREILHREDESFPSENVFRRFGNKAALVQTVADHCRERPEDSDVYALMIAALPPGGAKERASGTTETGFVYLLRIYPGRALYKIGKSVVVDRREWDLSAANPDLRREHIIETDDPSGIENYWHRRFAGKRKTYGKEREVFELNPEDVVAFKRRKFM